MWIEFYPSSMTASFHPTYWMKCGTRQFHQWAFNVNVGSCFTWAAVWRICIMFSFCSNISWRLVDLFCWYFGAFEVELIKRKVQIQLIIRAKESISSLLHGKMHQSICKCKYDIAHPIFLKGSEALLSIFKLINCNNNMLLRCPKPQERRQHRRIWMFYLIF